MSKLATVPGSQPGTPTRNGRPETKWYTHWRGRPLPVIPYAERSAGGRPRVLERTGKCGDCGCYPAAKKHMRDCLGLDVPATPGKDGYSNG